MLVLHMTPSKYICTSIRETKKYNCNSWLTLFWIWNHKMNVFLCTCLRSMIEKCSIPVFNLIHISVDRDCPIGQSHLHSLRLICVKWFGHRQFTVDSVVVVIISSVVVRSGTLAGTTRRTESWLLLSLRGGSSFGSGEFSIRYASLFEESELFNTHRHSVWFSKVSSSISGWLTPLVAT